MSCNIGVRRLHTSIWNKNRKFKTIQHKLLTEDLSLAGPVNEYIDRRRAVNGILMEHISQIHALDGYTGKKVVGTQLGADDDGAVEGDDVLGGSGRAALDDGVNDDLEDTGDDVEDEAVLEEYSRLTDWLSNLSLSA